MTNKREKQEQRGHITVRIDAMEISPSSNEKPIEDDWTEISD